VARSGDTSTVTRPVSIAALLDSADFSLPDTSEFTLKKYRVSFTPDYVARPNIGYTRDNFGRGFYGGSAVSLSDMLGNHQLVFAGYVNGHVNEAQILAAYANLSHRVNWATGITQDPYYFLEPSRIETSNRPGEAIFITNIRRLIVRSVFASAYYPVSRFQRIETGLRFANVDDAILQVKEPFDRATGFPTDDPFLDTQNRAGVTYVQPTVALVFDNSLTGYVSPFYGHRYRIEVSPSIGSWMFTLVNVDYRRYDRILGPLVFASRFEYYGRMGRDADEFRIFAGTTDLIRGNTSGSYRRNECLEATQEDTQTGCRELDRLVGTQLAVGSFELRMPLFNPSLNSPALLPPMEFAVFYDIGLIWNDRSTIRWNRAASDDPSSVRAPLKTIGLSLRTNLFGFAIGRLDYAIPFDRPAVNGLWTFSLGPAF
jgi:hypothetical protein